MAYKDTEKRRANQRKYNKKRRENNKEKIKEENRKYREDNKDKIKENEKRYRENNKDKIREYSKKYYDSHKDIVCNRSTKKYHCLYNKSKTDTKYLAEILWRSILSGIYRYKVLHDSKENIINFILNNKTFNILYEKWITTGKDEHCPSIGRCNQKEGYFIWNLFISDKKHVKHYANNCSKEHFRGRKPVIIINYDRQETLFTSMSDCAKFLQISRDVMRTALKKGYYKTYTVKHLYNYDEECMSK